MILKFKFKNQRKNSNLDFFLLQKMKVKIKIRKILKIINCLDKKMAPRLFSFCRLIVIMYTKPWRNCEDIFIYDKIKRLAKKGSRY